MRNYKAYINVYQQKSKISNDRKNISSKISFLYENKTILKRYFNNDFNNDFLIEDE